MNNTRDVTRSQLISDAGEEGSPITNGFDINLFMPVEWTTDPASVDPRDNMTDTLRY